MFRVVFLFLLCLSFVNCYVAPPEALYSYDELIDQTETILLVECISSEVSTPKNSRKKHSKLKVAKYQLRIVETLKGESKDILSASGFPRKHSENTFTNHSDSSFWNSNLGRTEIYAGECGPQHCFAAGNQYLYFVETRINSKAAEMINSDNDKWLLYVRERLAKNNHQD